MPLLLSNQQRQSSVPCWHQAARIDRSWTLWWLYGLPCPPASRKHLSCDNHSVPQLETACCHHAVMVSQGHCCGRTFYRPDALFCHRTNIVKARKAKPRREIITVPNCTMVSIITDRSVTHRSTATVVAHCTSTNTVAAGSSRSPAYIFFTA